LSGFSQIAADLLSFPFSCSSSPTSSRSCER
jgi:hypothetical protein